jgi:hypothetical protein
MNIENLESRIIKVEKKNAELESVLLELIKTMGKNNESMLSIRETFQNIDSYLKVNVGPPLFIE